MGKDKPKALEQMFSNCVDKRLEDFKRAVSSNEFNGIMDSLRDYFKLEEAMARSNYTPEIHNIRKRMFDAYLHQHLNKMEFK
ncbi:Uncharacterised protein [uncultured archaeon]|nr:Uncharacterised protein [uncultured archaeon]